MPQRLREIIPGSPPVAWIAVVCGVSPDRECNPFTAGVLDEEEETIYGSRRRLVALHQPRSNKRQTTGKSNVTRTRLSLCSSLLESSNHRVDHDCDRVTARIDPADP